MLVCMCVDKNATEIKLATKMTKFIITVFLMVYRLSQCKFEMKIINSFKLKISKYDRDANKMIYGIYENDNDQ